MALSPLVASLQPHLPENLKISLYHLSHGPKKTSSLYSSPPGRPPLPTTLESHFLTASHEGILIFAIEVLIYVTTRSKSAKESTIFVSKADSSGYLPSSLASFRPKDSSPGTKRSALRTLTTTFLSQILSDHHIAYPHNVKTTISLFARAQNQYLFPNSVENKNKHVLDDRGLIRWWTRVLDPILQKYSLASSGSNSASNVGNDEASAYLLVPGLDKYETSALFPPRTRQPDEYKDSLRWTHGHPLQTDPKQGLFVREIIPHFPDDPKARFLDELNGAAQPEEEAEKKKKKKMKKPVKQAVTIGAGWNNVKDLDQFWELMSFRQECSMGRCVGFIWVVIERNYAEGKRKASEDERADDKADDQIHPILPPPSQTETAAAGPASDIPKIGSSHTHLILPSKTYDKITESLLHTDFGRQSYAQSHSRQWVEGATSLAAETISKLKNRDIKDGWDWGEVVNGQLKLDTSIPTPCGATHVNTVHVVSVRSKKKRDIDNSTADRNVKTDNIRKKEENGVNVLGAGLVRKKPKLNAEGGTENGLSQPLELQQKPVHADGALLPVRKDQKENNEITGAENVKPATPTQT